MTFLLIPPYLIFAFFVMRTVLKKQPTRKQKWQMGLLTAFLLYLPFGWDVILGRAVFYGLCATQGGVHVYQTVELGPEYFDRDGVPLFYDSNFSLDDMSLAGRYIGNYHGKDISKFLNIKIRYSEIIDKTNGEVFGDVIHFLYFGGWFSNYTGFHVSGERCPSNNFPGTSIINLSKKVFVMKDN